MGVERPKNGAASAGSGCFSGVLKLLLCKGSLEEHHHHPDDIISEPKTTPARRLKTVAELKPPPVAAAAAAAPGVVARLMGLESLPLDTKWVGPLEDAVRRSKSVNFMDYLLLELDYSKPQHPEEAGGVASRHRRVRTSVSFREPPGPLTPRKQNHVVVLVNDSKERAIKKRNLEVGPSYFRILGMDAVGARGFKPPTASKTPDALSAGQQKPKALKKEKNQHREAPRVSKSNPSGCVGKKKVPVGRRSEARGSTLKPVNEKEMLVESKFMKQMKQQKTRRRNYKENGNGEVESEGSSPVSVLDVKETSSGRRQRLKFSDDVRLKDPIRKKEFKGSRIKKAGGQEAVKRKDSCGLAENRSIEVEEYIVEFERKLWELTEAEMEDSNWVEKATSGFQGLEEICFEFGSELFDHLLFQVVQELC